MVLRKLSALAFIAGAVGCFASPAGAQATRTWVSGVGDDVNPCSRTAPCKTFAGAISKTAAGGEINCLDPGGFGAVTITKSMTISCPYTEGGALAGGNGIVINDSATESPGTAVVVIRGLDIFGVSPPSNGIRFVSGAALHVEDATIRRFNALNSAGISFEPSRPAKLYVTRTTITDNSAGIRLGGSAAAFIGASMIANNAGAGIGAAGQAVAQVSDSSIVGNGSGIDARGNAVAYVADTLIAGNGSGITTADGGKVNSYGGNRVNGNGDNKDGKFSGPAARQ